ncbi:hypothetical protein QTP88_016403 [Uroleucon formosanum]
MARSCAAGPEVCVIIGGDNIGSDRAPELCCLKPTLPKIIVLCFNRSVQLGAHCAIRIRSERFYLGNRIGSQNFTLDGHTGFLSHRRRVVDGVLIADRRLSANRDSNDNISASPDRIPDEKSEDNASQDKQPELKIISNLIFLVLNVKL